MSFLKTKLTSLYSGSPTSARQKENRIQVFGSVPTRKSTRALDVEFERTVLGVDDIVWTFKIAQVQVMGVRVVREVQGQTYVISVLLSCVC